MKNLLFVFIMFMSFSVKAQNGITFFWNQDSVHIYNSEYNCLYFGYDKLYQPTTVKVEFRNRKDIRSLKFVDLRCIVGEGESCSSYILVVEELVQTVKKNGITYYTFATTQEDVTVYNSPSDGYLIVIVHSGFGTNFIYKKQ